MVVYKIHPVNPQQRHLETVARILKFQNGVAVYPTDTVYGMGASITNPKALERISRILHKDKTRLFSFICSDFAQISEYAIMNNAHFKLMKRHLPGPFTFILPATNFVPKKISPKRKTIGVRIPLYPAIQQLVALVGVPLANASINLPEAMRGDPDMVMSATRNEVEAMLDAGPLPEPIGSTIVDLTGAEPVVVRPGKGVLME
ncbi:MAG: L-threonylcarbamoyladenylate synthase [Chitinispirillaceae bacterium]|jgi:tRNA threonylcarbamoyl adenosine modification protein (Sua5/YciO/YrdC/YwlC family)